MILIILVIKLHVQQMVITFSATGDRTRSAEINFLHASKLLLDPAFTARQCKCIRYLYFVTFPPSEFWESEIYLKRNSRSYFVHMWVTYGRRKMFLWRLFCMFFFFFLICSSYGALGILCFVIVAFHGYYGIFFKAVVLRRTAHWAS